MIIHETGTRLATRVITGVRGPQRGRDNVPQERETRKRGHADRELMGRKHDSESAGKTEPHRRNGCSLPRPLELAEEWEERLSSPNSTFTDQDRVKNI